MSRCGGKPRSNVSRKLFTSFRVYIFTERLDIERFYRELVSRRTAGCTPLRQLLKISELFINRVFDMSNLLVAQMPILADQGHHVR